MITSIPRDDIEAFRARKNEYLRTLIAPTDGMWEGAIIARAAFWEMQDDGQYAGYYCVDANNRLLRFHLREEYRGQAQVIFGQIISTHDIDHAMSSTAEPFYLSLCLDRQTGVSLHGYLFRDTTFMQAAFDLADLDFRQVEASGADEVIRFYQNNTEGSGEWIADFLHGLIRDKALFGLYAGGTLVASGECIPSQDQPPYADLGMVVDRAYRRRGVGSSMLVHLKRHCYAVGWKPICGCAVANIASKKAIEKAGFVAEHRMVNVTFSSAASRN